LAQCVELLFSELKALGGHHFPQEAKVKFEGELSLDKELFITRIEEKVNESINSNVFTEIITEESDNTRMLKIGAFPPIPCGGTHVENLSELDGIHIRGVKIKKREIIVGYDLVD
jgi:alanyl-tRNA synthetase